MAQKSLRDKTITGVGWSFAESILGHGVTLLVGIVLARILSPAEYGVIGIVTIFTTIMAGFVDCGFSSSLIRKKDTTEEDYNTMFITNLVFSVLMYVVLFFSAPFIAVFFNNDILIPVLRVMGLLLIIQALTIVQNTIFTKRIDFKSKTKASLSSSIISGIIGIIMAFIGFGVWALVVQQLTKHAFHSLALWMMNRWNPSFRFSKESFHYMWGYGWKMMLSSLLNNVWNQIYQLVVGKFYSPATLGHYSKAKEYASLFSSNFNAVVQRVSYPSLAQLQDDKPRLVSAYRKIIKTTMFITAIVLLALGAVAEPFIYCLIGPQWQQAATFLPLICLSLSLMPLHSINLNMLQVQGRSDLFLYLEIIKKFIAVGPICLGIFVNIYCMLIGSIVTGVISFFLNSYYTGKSLKYSSWMQLADVAPFYGIGTVIALSVYFIKFIPISYFVILPIQVIIGFVVLLCLCKFFHIDEYYEIKKITFQYIKKIKNR